MRAIKVKGKQAVKKEAAPEVGVVMIVMRKTALLILNPQIQTRRRHRILIQTPKRVALKIAVAMPKTVPRTAAAIRHHCSIITLAPAASAGFFAMLFTVRTDPYLIHS